MKRIVRDAISQPLLLTLFIIFITALFIGDGKQSVTDIISAGGTLSLLVVAKYFSVRQRLVPTKITAAWFIFLLYLIAGTFFSDDVGYSVYITVRWIEMYLIFTVFYSYSTHEMIRVLPRWVVGFSLFSLVTAIIYTLVPSLGKTLLLANLLTPVYGHNHVIDILLFGFPVALLWYIKKQSWKRLILVAIFLFGIVFSFARAGIALTTVFSLGAVLVTWKSITKKFKVISVVMFVLFLLGGTAMFVIPKQSLKQLSGISSHISGALQRPIFEDARFEYWRQAVEAIKERPIFGSGPGTFILQSKKFQISPSSYSAYAHNSILEFVTELGIGGLLFFAVFIVWFIRSIRNFFLLHNNENLLEIKTFIAVISVQFTYALLDFSLAFFVIQALIVVLISIVVMKCGKQQKNDVSKVSYAIMFGCIIIVLLFYCNEVICVMAGTKQTPLPYCCLLSSSRASDFVINEKGKNTKVNTVSYAVHRKNSEIIYQIAQNDTVPEEYRYFPIRLYALNPHDENIKSFVIKRIIDSRDMRQLVNLMQSGFVSAFPSGYECFDAADKGMVETIWSIAADYEETKYINDWQAKMQYIFGYLCISKDEPEMAKALWENAAKLSHWSYFTIEQAVLEKKMFGSKERSVSLLNDCVNRDLFDSWLCADFDTISDRPGKLLDRIISLSTHL